MFSIHTTPTAQEIEQKLLERFDGRTGVDIGIKDGPHGDVVVVGVDETEDGSWYATDLVWEAAEMFSPEDVPVPFPTKWISDNAFPSDFMVDFYQAGGLQFTLYTHIQYEQRPFFTIMPISDTYKVAN